MNEAFWRKGGADIYVSEVHDFMRHFQDFLGELWPQFPQNCFTTCTSAVLLLAMLSLLLTAVPTLLAQVVTLGIPIVVLALLGKFVCLHAMPDMISESIAKCKFQCCMPVSIWIARAT